MNTQIEYTYEDKGYIDTVMQVEAEVDHQGATDIYCTSNGKDIDFWKLSITTQRYIVDELIECHRNKEIDRNGYLTELN